MNADLSAHTGLLEPSPQGGSDGSPEAGTRLLTFAAVLLGAFVLAFSMGAAVSMVRPAPAGESPTWAPAERPAPLHIPH